MFNISAKTDLDLDDPDPTWKIHTGSAKFDYYEFHNKVMIFKAQTFLDRCIKTPSTTDVRTAVTDSILIATAAPWHIKVHGYLPFTIVVCGALSSSG